MSSRTKGTTDDLFDIIDGKAPHDQKLHEIRTLISTSTDLNVYNEDGYTPLIFSIRRDYKDIAELLIRSGANLNMKSKHDLSALHCSINNNWIDLVFLILEKGGDINIKNAGNSTALMEAAAKNNCYVAELLIEKGALVNERNACGFTALILAVKYERPSIVYMLLKAGADMEIVDDYGDTCLSMAKFKTSGYDHSQMALSTLTMLEHKRKGLEISDPMASSYVRQQKPDPDAIHKQRLTRRQSAASSLSLTRTATHLRIATERIVPEVTSDGIPNESPQKSPQISPQSKKDMLENIGQRRQSLFDNGGSFANLLKTADT